MDLLKRELERKKKNVEKAKSASGDGRRFFRAKDLRRLEEEEEEEKEEKYQANRKRKSHDDTSQDEKGNESAAASLKSGVGLEREAKDKLVGGDASSNNKETENSSKKSRTDEGHEESKALKMSPEEVNERLRGLGYPIKLFGESAWDRIQRLRLALDAHNKIQADLTEKEETRLGQGHGIRNPFLEKDDNELELNANVEGGAEDGKASGDDTNNKHVDNEDLDENDPHKRVYKYFKGLVKQWEEGLSSRPEAVKKSVAGRNETKTFKQCKDYIRPMFKLCKNRRMDESILTKLNKIVSFCLEEEFVKAHDTYIDISIGRAAWPIGVTQVGIHSRTGRAKIESSNIAHVMNSELQRKYLTSVKRLMTYAQKHSNAAPSKKVM